MFAVKRQCVIVLDEWGVWSNMVLEIRCSTSHGLVAMTVEVEVEGRGRNYFTLR
jgi:hypothetical protein